jgi:Uma2 family endonuclease
MTAMSIAALTRPVPVEAEPSLYRFSVDQYLQMVQHDVLGPDDHVELLEGWIVKKMSRNPPRDASINRINRRLTKLLPEEEWVIRIQSALVLARSVPEPDIAIVRAPEDRYFHRHPRAADSLLLIEVADWSRLKDRQQKGLWYAEAKVPEFWLVNLVAGIVEVYTQPRGGRTPAYRDRRNYTAGEKVPLLLDGREIARLAVTDLCPVKA